MDQHQRSRLVPAFARGLTRRRLLEGAVSVLAGGGATGLLAALSRGGNPASAASSTAGLAEAINAYRVANGKPPIPVSPELTKVAQAHVHDLMQFANQPPYTTAGCQLHSWSNNGPWTGGCYNVSNSATWPIMLNKPKEIANYPAIGVENLAWSTGTMTPDEAVKLWASDAPHNDVMLNLTATWQTPWLALGGWVEGSYASAWFGTATDPTPATPAASPVAGKTGTAPNASQAAPAAQGNQFGQQPAAPTQAAPTQAAPAAPTQPAPPPAAPTQAPPPTAPVSTAMPVSTVESFSTVEVISTVGPISTAPPSGTTTP